MVPDQVKRNTAISPVRIEAGAQVILEKVEMDGPHFVLAGVLGRKSIGGGSSRIYSGG